MVSSSKQRSSNIKVGFLTLFSLSLLVGSFIWLRGRGLSSGTTYDVLFEDVNGMREGSAVQIMGVRVGFIDKIQPFQTKNGRYYVQVQFTVNETMGEKIPPGSTLSIEQSGLIGEQFLEVTPPQSREVVLTTFKTPAKKITPGIPVKFLYDSGYLKVGQVEQVVQLEDGDLIQHRLVYRITRPGAKMPENPVFSLVYDKSDSNYYLRITSKEALLVKMPDKNLVFTVENPMRLKRFLKIQMDSAEALKLTNDKINELLSDETIDSLHSTLKNTEILTAQASEVMRNANQLFQRSQNDLTELVSASQSLMTEVSAVSHNVNRVIGRPELQAELTETVTSIKNASIALKSLLEDPALKESITLLRDTGQSASRLTSTLNQTIQNPAVQNRVTRLSNQLDGSLTKLDQLLTTLDGLTDDDAQTLKGILLDTRETAENMKVLSKKFNGHFTLFKLLF